MIRFYVEVIPLESISKTLWVLGFKYTKLTKAISFSIIIFNIKFGFVYLNKK